MKDLTISSKLHLAGGLSLALTLSLGTCGLFYIVSLTDQLKMAVSVSAQSQRLAGGMNRAAAELLSLHRAAMLEGYKKETLEVQRSEHEYEEESARLRALCADMEALATSPEARDLLTRIRSLDLQLDEASATAVHFASLPDMDSAMKAHAERFVPLHGELQANTTRLLRLQAQVFAEGLKKAQTSSSSAPWLTGIMMLLALLVGVVTVFVIRQIDRLLRRTVSELGQCAVQIASASTQMAAGSQSMAQGASQQAATLQETSASSYEINSMAQRNTENSQATAQMVAKSQESFEATDQSLLQMVEAMQDMNGSSQKISRIIKVIDEIAFQTNILALNASVEAAHAGGAGMGFAVVAEEVGNLAERCAQAAKETANLIQDSMAKSGGGKAKVDVVADLIRAVTADGSKMKLLIDEINLGSVEQARGIDQITRSIHQMTEVTQSAAANAEQSAAAADRLSAQSEAMQKVVQRLNLVVEGTPHGVRPGRRSATEGSSRPVASFSEVVLARSKFSLPKQAANLAPIGNAALLADSAFPMEDHFEEF